MPICVFENSREVSIPFILHPDEERHDLPPLAKIGVRYSVEPGQIDRSFTDVGEHSIGFWCESETREIEIVHPSAFDRLLKDICVNGGWCGDVVNGQLIHITDLLPMSGTVTAEEFARLVIYSEGDPGSAANIERWSAYLQSKFIEHMGSISAPADALVQNFIQPFDSVFD